MKLLLSIIFFCVAQTVYCQFKLKDIPYNLSEINKRNIQGKQGIWIFYDRVDSTVYAMQNFINDTLQGYFERYWPNGIVSEKGFYKKGKLDSLFIAYWQDGKKRAEVFYGNGLLNGISIAYDNNERLIERANYINGKIDSNYKFSYIDSNMVWDDRARDKIDTVISRFKSNWNKKYAIYVNDTLSKELDFFNDNLVIESFYDRAILTKRIIYFKVKPYSIEKVFFYNSGELDRTYYYDKKGNIIKKE